MFDFMTKVCILKFGPAKWSVFAAFFGYYYPDKNISAQ